MATLSDFLELDIQPKSISSRQQKVKCPKCKDAGKKNLNDNCLSINMTTGLYNCHKCSWSGKVRSEQTITQMIEQTKQYILPKNDDLSDIKNNAIQFLKDRGITQEVIDNNKVKSSRDGRGVVFAYYKNSKVINYKTRAIDSKKFFQAKEAQPIMYNYDRIKDTASVFICEGNAG